MSGLDNSQQLTGDVVIGGTEAHRDEPIEDTKRDNVPDDDADRGTRRGDGEPQA